MRSLIAQLHSPDPQVSRAARERLQRQPVTSEDGARAVLEALSREAPSPRQADDSPREVLLRLILGISPEIHEELKWNAPSFRTTDHFATFNLRTQDRIRLILHTGAKVKATAAQGMKLADPTGLVEWLAKDRCLHLL